MVTALPIYQIDAFTDTVFSGNTAAVCILDSWLDKCVLQKIAAENNQSETAFLVKAPDNFEIRWFTPTCEVELCGHATLASAFVLFNEFQVKEKVIHLKTTKRGSLYVTKRGKLFELDFPVDTLEKTFLPYGLIEAFGYDPVDVYRGKDDYLIIFENEEQIKTLTPDFEAISSINARGVICTAPGDSVDFVSRFFGPQSGLNEDPVTGSAHTSLAPYYAEKLNKTTFKASQLSARGGYLEVTLVDDRVKIAGSAVLYMKGEIYV